MKHYNHLLERDRSIFQQLYQAGSGMTEIARYLGRHRSTLYREIARNKFSTEYLSHTAEQISKNRSCQRRVSKISRYQTLRAYISAALKKGWSPEQISGRLKRKKSKYAVCHETIYRYIYQHREKKLYKYLKYKSPRRHAHYARKQRECRFGDGRLITARPKYIDLRERWGHWEGDNVEFGTSRKAMITTLVERKSRMVLLVKNKEKKSEVVVANIKNKVKFLPYKLFRTITFDQGNEFANFRSLEKESKCMVYFCHAHSPWEKGTNENTNGRLRRYLPREINIHLVQQQDLDKIADIMNTTPRKCLAFRTPNELFSLQYKSICRT